MSAKDYTLPATDPCHRDLEMLKSYLAPRVEAAERYYQYQQFLPLTKTAPACCRKMQQRIGALHRELPDEEPPHSFELTEELFRDKACMSRLENNPVFTSWVDDYQQERGEFWFDQYRSLTADLQQCCVQNFTLLEERAERLGQERKELQSRVVSVQASFHKMEEQAERLGQERKQLQSQVVSLQDSFDAAIRKMGDAQAATDKIAEERDRFQVELAAVSPRSGAELFAAFPAGEGGLVLALCGAIALLSGFLLGLAGYRRWRRRLQSGALAALLSLCVYLGLVYLLPDTRSPLLFLALGGALLPVSLRTLLRAFVLLRQQRTAAIP